MKLIEKFFKFLSSLKLAVIILLSISAVLAIGTFVESYTDAIYAQKTVYQSWYMYFPLVMLCICLMAVMVDRWPWKKRHTSFILAHIGIVILLVGSLVTQYKGIDGSMALEIDGKPESFVTLPDREIQVFVSTGEGGYTKLDNWDTDYIKKNPQKKSFTKKIDSKLFEVKKYHHFALRRENIEPSSFSTDGPAVQFTLKNDFIDLSRWIVQPRKSRDVVINFGPAKLVLVSHNNPVKEEGNFILLRSLGEKLEFSSYKRGQLTKTKELKSGDKVKPGWMSEDKDVVFSLVRYLPAARKQVTYKPIDQSTDETISALEIEYDGKPYWLGLNSLLRVYTDDRAYIFNYANKKIRLNFPLSVNKFEVGRYQGTQRAASYSSWVKIPQAYQNYHISMNEPLKHGGFTFYQASYEEDEMAKPTRSILSVNYDPGRPLKYFGSFLIVLGTLLLFYMKKFKKKIIKRKEQ